MHLTFADQSLLLDDAAAKLTVRYAAALASQGRADSVSVRAYGADGDKVEAVLLLDQGLTLMAETSHTDLPEPDNGDAVEYMQERLDALTAVPQAGPVDETDATSQLDPVIDLS
jgi:hypothetical protein